MNILEREGISPTVLGLLQFIRLNTGSEYIHGIIRQYLYDFETESGRKPLEILDEAGYIKYTKTGAKSRPWERVRLSEKGEQILKEMHQRSTHPLAELTLNYTKEQYNRIGAEKHISGGGKLLFYISEFLYYKDSYTEEMVNKMVKESNYEFESVNVLKNKSIDLSKYENIILRIIKNITINYDVN